MVAVAWWMAVFFGAVRAAPTRSPKDVVLVPVHQVPPPSSFGQYPYPMPIMPRPIQLRGPFDFIGDWIQQSEWFPVQVNIPDTVGGIGNGISQFTTNVGNGVSQISQNVGSGFQQFTQNVGSGLQQFTQNVGNGFNQWAQNVGQRIPWLANFVRPRPDTKLYVVVREQGVGGTGEMGDGGVDREQALQHNYLLLADDLAEAFV